jgi:hypothetical protein
MDLKPPPFKGNHILYLAAVVAAFAVTGVYASHLRLIGPFWPAVLFPILGTCLLVMGFVHPNRGKHSMILSVLLCVGFVALGALHFFKHR